MAAAGVPSLSLFPVLRAAVDCMLVVGATDTVFGSGQGLRLFVSSSGASCPVIDFALLQQGLPPHLQLKGLFRETPYSGKGLFRETPYSRQGSSGGGLVGRRPILQ